MKTIARSLTLVAWTILAALPAAAQTKIATIDVNKVFSNYYKRSQAEAALKEHAADLDKEYQAYVEDFKKTSTNYNTLLAESNDQTLSTEEREKRKVAAEAKLRELKSSQETMRAFESNAQDRMETQKKRMRDAIIADVRNAVVAKAKAAGYTLVVDSSADTITASPIVLYSNGENDITDAILSQLNAGAPPPTSDPDKKENSKKDDPRK